MPQANDVRELRRLREQEFALLDELNKRAADDPLKGFEPHEKQKEFIDAVLTGPFSENWFFAANRSGKSDAGAYCGASLARFGDPNARYVGGKGSSVQVRDRATSGWVSALDFPTSRDTIQPKYFDNGFVPPGSSHKPFIPEREIEEWRVADQILKLKNGSIIGFKSADSGRAKYQAAEKDWVQMDEEHPEEIYKEITIRVGTRRLRIFTTATILPPIGQLGGVSWTFPKIIQPWLDGLLPNIGIYNASIYDNPHIPREEIERLEAVFPEGTIDNRIRLKGELLPGISGSRAYPAFNRQLNVKEQPELHPRRPILLTFDFNVDPMACLVSQFETMYGGRRLLRTFRELILEGSADIASMIDLFKYHYPRHGSEIWLYGDATGQNRRVAANQEGTKSYFTLIQNELRGYGSPIRVKVPSSNPGVPDRLNAVNKLLRDENAEIRWIIDPSCTELIQDLEGVLRDARGGIKKVTNIKDPYFRRTHTSDAAGYLIAKEEPVKLYTQEKKQTTKLKQPSYGSHTSIR